MNYEGEGLFSVNDQQHQGSFSSHSVSVHKHTYQQSMHTNMKTHAQI